MVKTKILNINLIGGRTGAAQLAKTIVDGLPSDQFESHTLVGYNFGEKNDNITSLYKTSNSRLYKTIRYKFFVGLNFLFDWMTPGCINLKYLKNFKPYQEANVIHFHSIQGGYFDRKCLPQITKEKKVIMTLHDDWIVSGNDKESLFFPYKTKKSYKKRTEIFKNSQLTYIGVSNWIINKLKKVDIMGNNKAITLYNGIDEKVFYQKDKKTSRDLLGLPNDKTIIISIAGSGKKTNLKGLQYVEKIIEKYKNNKDLLFITVGNHKTKKTSDQYRELGRIDHHNMVDYFSASDIFLYPTLADNCPLTVLEGIACGLPLLSFDTGGITEIINHKENGYIVPFKNYNQLIIGFDWILNNKNKLNINLDQKFTQDNMVKDYGNLYKHILL